MTLTLKATRQGFYEFSPVNGRLAPNVFLETKTNMSGVLYSLDGDPDWHSLDRIGYNNYSILAAPHETLSQAVQLGSSQEVSFSEITFLRFETGQRVTTGHFHFDQPITVQATFDLIGPENLSGWHAPVGTAVTELLSRQGFTFLGGSGADIFSPHIPSFGSSFPVTGQFVLKGRGGDDILTGTQGDDRIYGGPGNDRLSDEYGVNRLYGNSGDDRISLGDTSENGNASGGAGADLLRSGNGADRLIGGRGDDLLLGGAGDDILAGGRDNDRLLGGDGRDRLRGGQGDDILTGGEGRDILAGGAGADQFVFDVGQDARDVIRDFEIGTDSILVHGFTGNFDDTTQTQRGPHTLVSIGTAGMEILFLNTETLTLTAEDFFFSDI